MNPQPRQFTSTKRDLFTRHIELQNLKATYPTFAEYVDRRINFMRTFAENNMIFLDSILLRERELLKAHCVRDGLAVNNEQNPVYKTTRDRKTGQLKYMFKSAKDESDFIRAWNAYLDESCTIII